MSLSSVDAMTTLGHRGCRACACLAVAGLLGGACDGLLAQSAAPTTDRSSRPQPIRAKPNPVKSRPQPVLKQQPLKQQSVSAQAVKQFVAAAALPGGAGPVFTRESAPRFAQALPPSDLRQTPAPLDPRGAPGGIDLKPSSAPLPKPIAPDAARGEEVASFVLRGVSFSGNTVYSGDDLTHVGRAPVGQSVRLSELEAIAQRVTEHYRKAGYVLAHALVPSQAIRDGMVELAVIEGRIKEVRVEIAPGTPVPEDLIKSMLARVPVGQPLRQRQLESALLLASDVPGVTVQSSLEQGEEAGTTNLLVEVGPSRRWDLSLDADNHGTKAIGEYRVGMLARIRSALQLGDSVDVRLMQSSGGRLDSGRLGFETPLGAYGTRAGLSLSRVHYALGADFAQLGATGVAVVADASVTHPFVRLRNENLIGRVGFASKRLTDHLNAVGSRRQRDIRSGSIGLNYERRDDLLAGGYSSIGLTGSFGTLAFDAAADRDADQGPGGRNTAGQFARLIWQASRLQGLTARTSAFVGFAGQAASKNLDSSEKMTLGGPAAVRAYSPSEAVVDEGYVLNAEYRLLAVPDVTVSGFYDYGRGSYNHSPGPGEANSVSLGGVGLGLYWSGPWGVTLRSSLAWRTSGPGRVDNDRIPRLYAQIIKAF